METAKENTTRPYFTGDGFLLDFSCRYTPRSLLILPSTPVRPLPLPKPKSCNLFKVKGKKLPPPTGSHLGAAVGNASKQRRYGNSSAAEEKMGHALQPLLCLSSLFFPDPHWSLPCSTKSPCWIWILRPSITGSVTVLTNSIFTGVLALQSWQAELWSQVAAGGRSGKHIPVKTASILVSKRDEELTFPKPLMQLYPTMQLVLHN